ncbi:UNVERIFIED_CONTAM: hypothetical protein HDU68_010972 [Siphonaria sp. JEL0065]|nr:hypothetical protein HDU68_010972 [Siphonaria sp. JEL0065]
MNSWPALPPTGIPMGFPPVAHHINQQRESDWITHTQPDGKPYYYNKVTQQSTWDKPDELKTPLERALSASPWKEHKTEDGRKYYSNVATRETVWKAPPEYQAIIDKFDIVIPIAPVEYHPPAPVAAPVVVVPVNFDSREAAELAFKDMLESANVGLDWTWEQTMRQVINNPMYRCLKTLTERKQAFQNYIEEKKARIKKEKEDKLAYERDSFAVLLGSLGADLNIMLRYKKMAEAFAEDPIFLSIDAERRVELFEEFMSEFRKKDAEDKRAIRKENVERFKHILKTTPTITATTTWAEAQNLWASHPDFLPPSPNSVNPLHSMEAIDILVTFEDHMKQLESVFFQEFDKVKNAERRRERQLRDEYRNLQDRLVKEGVIHVNSKWKEVYPFVADEACFDEMLGQPGSNPLELFWDVLVNLEDKYLAVRKEALDAVRVSGINVTIQTSFVDFEHEFRNYNRSGKFDQNTLKQVFDELMARAISKHKDDDRRKERKTRKRLDAFKSLLKHLSPRLASNATWDKVRTLVKGEEQYTDLDEDQRVYVFDKYIKKLKAREEEREASSSEESGDDGEKSRKRKSSSGVGRERDRREDKKRQRSARSDDEREVSRRGGDDRRRTNVSQQAPVADPMHVGREDLEEGEFSFRVPRSGPELQQHDPGSSPTGPLPSSGSHQRVHGSVERRKLQEALVEMREKMPFEVPCIVNGDKIYIQDTLKQPLPFDHKKTLANFHNADKNLIDKAIEGALAAQPAWKAMPFNDRAAISSKLLISWRYRYQVMAATC